MRVLLADKLWPAVAQELQAAGCGVTVDPQLKDDALVETLQRVDPEVLVVRSTKVRSEHLAAAPGLSLIIRAGAGVNTIDVAGASARGIYVANCPGKNAIAVAELTFGHLLNLDRRIADNVAALRRGEWAKKAFGKAEGVYGKTLALLGVGNIGHEVIRRAHAFGIEVRAWSRSLTPEGAAALGVTHAASPLEACQGADFLSVHLAKTPETTGIVSEELLEALNPGAFVLNTSRGELVDEPALLAAIESRGIRAGLDVFCNEPAATDNTFVSPVAQSEGVYGTHHIGASTEQAKRQVGQEVLDIVAQYRTEGTVRNCVNLAVQTSADHLLVVRHADRVGVLAGVLDGLRRGGINVQEMENIIFKGGAAACARLHLAGAPGPALLDELSASEHIFAVSLVSLES